MQKKLIQQTKFEYDGDQVTKLMRCRSIEDEPDIIGTTYKLQNGNTVTINFCTGGLESYDTITTLEDLPSIKYLNSACMKDKEDRFVWQFLDDTFDNGTGEKFHLYLHNYTLDRLDELVKSTKSARRKKYIDDKDFRDRTEKFIKLMKQTIGEDAKFTVVFGFDDRVLSIDNFNDSVQTRLEYDIPTTIYIDYDCKGKGITKEYDHWNKNYLNYVSENGWAWYNCLCELTEKNTTMEVDYICATLDLYCYGFSAKCDFFNNTMIPKSTKLLGNKELNHDREISISLISTECQDRARTFKTTLQRQIIEFDHEIFILEGMKYWTHDISLLIFAEMDDKKNTYYLLYKAKYTPKSSLSNSTTNKLFCKNINTISKAKDTMDIKYRIEYFKRSKNTFNTIHLLEYNKDCKIINSVIRDNMNDNIFHCVKSEKVKDNTIKEIRYYVLKEDLKNKDIEYVLTDKCNQRNRIDYIHVYDNNGNQVEDQTVENDKVTRLSNYKFDDKNRQIEEKHYIVF